MDERWRDNGVIGRSRLGTVLILSVAMVTAVLLLLAIVVGGAQ